MDRPVRELLFRMGTGAQMSARLGIPEARIHKWRLRSRVPWQYWETLAAHAPPDSGVTVEALMAAHRRQEPWPPMRHVNNHTQVSRKP